MSLSPPLWGLPARDLPHTLHPGEEEEAEEGEEEEAVEGEDLLPLAPPALLAAPFDGADRVELDDPEETGA